MVNHPFSTVTAATLQVWPPRDSTEAARRAVPCSKATWKLLRFNQHYVSLKRAEDVTSTEETVRVVSVVNC